MRKRILLTSAIWMATMFDYVGLTLNSANLSGDYYLNFAVNAAIELPSTLFNLFLASKFSRKFTLGFFFVITALGSLMGIFTNEGSGATLAAGTIAKFGICGSFNMIILFVCYIFVNQMSLFKFYFFTVGRTFPHQHSWNSHGCGQSGRQSGWCFSTIHNQHE